LRILGIAAKWLFMLCLPVMLLAASIGWAANSLWLYEYGSEENNVRQDLADAGLELTDSQLEDVYAGLISYFNSSEEYISLTIIKDGKPFELFNEREVAHLRDVKDLIWLDYRFLLVTLIYTLGYAGVSLLWRKDWRRLAQGVVRGSGITLALMLALGLGILLNFDRFFWQFHVISFTNELWQLDPTKDYLIMLFPQGFWYDAALFCAVATAAGAMILAAIAGGYLLFTRSRAVS